VKGNFMSRVKLGILGLEEAKRLALKGKRQGLDIILEHNDQTCSRGCAVTVEIWGSAEQAHQISEFLNEDFKTHAKGEVNWSQTQEVVDLSLPEAICPACGTKFKTELSQCPDCGLCF
jgi:hypothetical protein